MNISITKFEPSVKEIRKAKLNAIHNEKPQLKGGYNWELIYESADEKLEDFHLFCISIVKDLLHKSFFTNERCTYIYEGMEDEYDETIADLEHLYWLIEESKKNENPRR